MKRKINFMIWAVAMMLLSFQMSSCSEHVEDWHGNVTTGSVLLSNNSIISVHGYDASKMTAVGVVIGTRKIAYGLSLQRTSDKQLTLIR